jgi:hypothetical protein
MRDTFQKGEVMDARSMWPTQNDLAAKVRTGAVELGGTFTEISRGVDKLLWKVEAHVQAKD